MVSELRHLLNRKLKYSGRNGTGLSVFGRLRIDNIKPLRTLHKNDGTKQHPVVVDRYDIPGEVDYFTRQHNRITCSIYLYQLGPSWCPPTAIYVEPNILMRTSSWRQCRPKEIDSEIRIRDSRGQQPNTASSGHERLVSSDYQVVEITVSLCKEPDLNKQMQLLQVLRATSRQQLSRWLPVVKERYQMSTTVGFFGLSVADRLHFTSCWWNGEATASFKLRRKSTYRNTHYIVLVKTDFVVPALLHWYRIPNVSPGVSKYMGSPASNNYWIDYRTVKFSSKT
ncbi:hypothetical protein CLF_102047 [Clonorchis sinensis]|uniref:Uncharacterized protein n=1 Tax=Clonorchis sinensis TaxID=79923 RepID=G7Y761_CLOSI|nr:hypothetical protein CLF_102047 [Clonorchis sinensis]